MIHRSRLNLIDYAPQPPQRRRRQSLARLLLIAVISAAGITVLDNGPRIVRHINVLLSRPTPGR
jgi:hypothetical protein